MARGRMFQDDSFVYDEIGGALLERLLVCEDFSGLGPVFLKPVHHKWQRFFLDAGLGFWGEYEDDDIENELEESPVRDYGAEFKLIGHQLGQVRCGLGPRISVEFSSGVLILETARPGVLDAPSRLRFVPASGGA